MIRYIKIRYFILALIPSKRLHYSLNLFDLKQEALFDPNLVLQGEWGEEIGEGGREIGEGEEKLVKEEEKLVKEE